MAFEEIYDGERNEFPVVHTFYPDSALQTTLAGYESAGTYNFEEVYVVISTSNPNEVSLAGNGVIPNGRIVAWKYDSTNTYILSVGLFCYADYEAEIHTFSGGIYKMNYGDNSAPSIGEEIQMDGTTGTVVDGVTTGGVGKILAVDTDNAYVMVLI